LARIRARRARNWRDTGPPRHVGREDFRFLAALHAADAVLGFVYRYTGAYGQWWTDLVARAMDGGARGVARPERGRG
jgi:hypothetical protein